VENSFSVGQECKFFGHTVAAVPAKTANKSWCAHASFILTQIRARGEVGKLVLAV